jgi:hypothetical protein
MSPDFPRGTVNLIGGELDVDETRIRMKQNLAITTPLLHWSSHTDDLAMKAYPCKRNQEHKQEQEMQSNKLDYEMGSHKPMNGDTI